MLKVTNLEKAYPGTEDEGAAVRGISFDVEEGEIFTLLGPSGCGKTTTLRCVAGLETPTNGRIDIADRPVFSSADRTLVPAHQRALGMVFQSYAVWPHLSVLRNVMYPLRAARVRKHEARRRALDALEMVGLREVAERWPSELSGGQQQRVALARAVVRNTQLLLLDEPLSNLDAKLRVQMRDEIRALQRQLGATVLYVTHDQEEAMTLSDRVAVMRSGVIIELNTPAELYISPKHLFTARFVGESNLLRVKLLRRQAGVTEVGANFGTLRTKNHYSSEEGRESRYYFFVRPENIEIAREPARDRVLSANEFHGVVASVSFLGKTSEHRVTVGSDELIVHCPANHSVPVGEEVRLRVHENACAVYESDEQLQPAPQGPHAESRVPAATFSD